MCHERKKQDAEVENNGDNYLKHDRHVGWDQHPQGTLG